MLINILFLLVVLLGFYKGWKNGILSSIFFLVAFVLGIIAALKVSYLLAVKLEEWFSISAALLPVIAFILMFVLVAVGIILLGRIIEKALKLIHLNLINRVIGATLWIFIGVFIFSTFLWYIDKYNVISEETKESSFGYKVSAPVSPYVVDKTGEVIPFVKDLYVSISEMIERLSEDHLQKEIEIDDTIEVNI